MFVSERNYPGRVFPTRYPIRTPETYPPRTFPPPQRTYPPRTYPTRTPERNYPKYPNYPPTTPTIEVTTKPPPDTCNTSYDAISVIRRDVFIFKDAVSNLSNFYYIKLYSIRA